MLTGHFSFKTVLKYSSQFYFVSPGANWDGLLKMNVRPCLFSYRVLFRGLFSLIWALVDRQLLLSWSGFKYKLKMIWSDRDAAIVG
jgi:hypothetical protein